MEIRTFNSDTQKITTLYDDNQTVWFVASEVCKILGYKNTSKAIKDNCQQKGITNGYTLTSGGKQKSILINEPNLYRLIMRSRIDKAIKFQDWVVEEVLPSIRKTGQYNVAQSLKKLSIENRNILTDAWKDCGINKRHHFSNLTLQEYKSLGFAKGKRKKDLTKEELLTLSALESMEALKLFHDKKEGYYECRDSIIETSDKIPYKSKKELK